MPGVPSSDGPETLDPGPPCRLALRRQTSVTVPHAIKCLCSKRLGAKGADMTLCPMHSIDYLAALPIDRPKLACIPPEANIKSLPPFVVGEQVVLLGNVPPSTSSSSPSPPKSPLKKLLAFEHWRSTVRIVSDASYCVDGTFSIQTSDGTIYDGISSMRLESTTKGANDMTPRYVDKLILKLGRTGADLNVRELAIVPPTEMRRNELEAMLAQYSKLIELNYLLPINMSTVLCRRSALYAALGDYEASLQDAEVAIGLQPKMTNAHFRKGVALASLGAFPDACIALRRGLEVDASCAHLRHALQVAMDHLHHAPKMG